MIAATFPDHCSPLVTLLIMGADTGCIPFLVSLHCRGSQLNGKFGGVTHVLGDIHVSHPNIRIRHLIHV